MTSSGAGVLFIVANYTGDVASFKEATNLVRSEGMGALIVVIDDDVAVEDSFYTDGRRGAGTIVLAQKIVGAAAERGYDLMNLAALGRKVNTHGRSIGVALTPCTVPTAGEPAFRLEEDEMEVGIGIHGEAGRRRTELKRADEITEMLTLSLIEDEEYVRRVPAWNPDEEVWVETQLVDPPLKEGDEVLALVNSMGGTPDLELMVVYRKLHEICQAKGLRIVRNLIGRYVTSLEMQGVSITLLKMDDEMIELWDDPVLTPGLRWRM
jgi:dihydroxyacetone kinase-like protein